MQDGGKQMDSKSRCGYVYMFLDGSDNVVYVGSTGNISNRMYQHLNGRSGRFRFERPEKIRYCKLPSRNDAFIAETVLIQKYKPKYNTASVNDGPVSLLSFDEFRVEWIVKSPDDFDRKHNDSQEKQKKEQFAYSRKRQPVFNALREIFPDADLRRDAVTEKQKWHLYAAFMSDGEYWLPRMTDFEVELMNEQMFIEFAKKGLFIGGIDAWMETN